MGRTVKRKRRSSGLAADIAVQAARSGRRFGQAVTRQTWTALVSALAFICLAVLLVVVPVPFVSWTPGGTRDTLGNVGNEPMIRVQGVETYPTTGRLDMTIVAITPADARLSLPQALLAYWLPHRDALPRDAIYAPGKTAEQVENEDADMMETAQDDAVVAALRADGRPVTEMPAIFSVTVGGPAHKLLLPGDLVVSVDGIPTRDDEAVRERILAHRVGQKVKFGVIRNNVQTEVTVTTVESNIQSDVPVVGITLGTGYRYDPEISFDLGQQIGGPSAGLVFALAIYDKITNGPLLAGRHLAGTGTITPNGDVQAIGGIQEKISAAQKAGATAFFVPANNCHDLEGVHTTMTLIKVATLSEAIKAVQAVNSHGDGAVLPHC
jgi:Lon-like protease